MRILMLGAGAIGGYFGARLVEAGADVTFLVRTHRAMHLSKNGLLLTSPLGNAAVAIKTATDAASVGKPALVMLACKAYDLPSALDAISPAVSNETIILPLLNGIAHLEETAARFPSASVWGGVTYIAITLTPDGAIRHLNQSNSILFGPRDGETDVRTIALQAAFSGTPVDAQPRQRIEQDLWNKFVFIATLAGVTCLMRSDIGTILRTPRGSSMILQLLYECASVARAEGYELAAERIADYQGQLTQTDSTAVASMLRDMHRGGATEGAHILTDMLHRARSRNVDAPLLEIAATNLAVYEKQRLSTVLP